MRSFTMLAMLTLGVLLFPATRADAAAAVVTRLVQTGDILDTIGFSGEIRPFEESHVTPDVSGRVDKVMVENGRKVKVHEPVVLVESERLELAVRQAEVELKRAEQELKEKRKDFQRRQILLEKKVLNEKAYDEAETNFVQAENQVKSAKVALELAKVNLARARITAPLTGTFVNRNVFIGQSVAPGMMLGKVVDLSRVYVDARIPENQINRIKIGQEAMIAGNHPGKVAFINLYGDDSRSFTVRILLDNPEEVFKPNMFARGEIVTQAYRNVPLLPINSLCGSSEKPTVFVVEGGKAVEKPVKLIARQGDRCYVEGITPGERLVTVGMAGISHGAEVTVSDQPEESGTAKAMGASASGTAPATASQPTQPKP